MDNMFSDALGQLLAEQCTPAVVRQIEGGADAAALWAQIAESGFADALVPESADGAGMVLKDACALWELIGRHALPLPLAETMLVRGWLAQAGASLPEGAIAMAPRARQAGGQVSAVGVRCAKVAQWVAVELGGETRLLAAAAASQTPAVFPLDAGLSWPEAVWTAAPVVPGAGDLQVAQAMVYAALLSGALMTCFERTLQFANERQQFGRPIGKFQIIQHELAQISEHAFSSRMAAQIACESRTLTPDPVRVAVGKARTSEAVVVVADFSHSIHGAIGFTAEFDLQLYTRRLHHWRVTAGSESHWHDVAGEALLADPSPLALDLIRRVSDAEASV
ncbi:acyl-CoA dehydrogenase [Comamonas serinivorans]|uniref:Acyl-CoA dehydrogenase n=1 Tax=Comamonas serinivorans TaxID=1082851 RepID=A0A1Y0EPK8_9BURK|nr:acyl-CoA dehydrogenase family protein [Comamonas serinivorans]ARU05341.1 acyl-CoA dehydrogenase [Comamonas serinivorans]